MGNRELRPLNRELSAEERAEIERARQLVAAELPQMKQRVFMLDEAAGEQTFSGTLRRSIHSSGIDLHLISKRVGMDVRQLDEFLTGERTLRSDVIDRLVMVLGIESVVNQQLSAMASVLPIVAVANPSAVTQ